MRGNLSVVKPEKSWIDMTHVNEGDLYMQHWLLKSEPSVFSIEDLERIPQQTSRWEGVRNYQARNYLRAMQVGDLGFFYHSSCTPPGIVGEVRVVRAAYPDDTAWAPASPYFDSRATPEAPIWAQVDVQLVSVWRQPLSLEVLKAHAASLGDFPLLRRGNRLSVLPVERTNWEMIQRISSDRS
jgi:predicted RNA-binding protein with PUA-like domain